MFLNGVFRKAVSRLTTPAGIVSASDEGEQVSSFGERQEAAAVRRGRAGGVVRQELAFRWRRAVGRSSQQH
jgi:hypothetical protein